LGGNRRIQKFTSDGEFVDKWGSEGSGDGEFSLPHDIALDSNGFVYVADFESKRIHKFTAEGEFVDSWEVVGKSDRWATMGAEGIAIDSNDFVYIADTREGRILKFTSDGQFITKWGEFGSNPGQMNHPLDIAAGLDGRIYVSDHDNDRIQVFKEVILPERSRAIIVAGGGPYAGNSLWDATRLCTNFAYRALTYQGYTKNDIHYLTADTNLDLDGNGIFDEITGFSDDIDNIPTNATLQHAITQWAVDENADSLTLYLNDHGGADTFRISDTETLSSSDLASWLDTFQSHTSGKITVVYDACESGSFLDDLEGSDRIIITSTLPGEQAKFLGQGNLSFSSFFWTHIFNGLSTDEAHSNASQVINFAFANQNPQLSGEAEHVYIGSGIEQIIGDAPEIGSISEPQEIDTETSAGLYAEDVIDPDGIARVWAVIWPPDHGPGSVEDPLLSLPTLTLMPVGDNRYEGTYTDFTADGTYHIAIYALDRNSNTSIPKLTSVSRNYHVVKKAVIVAGGEGINLTRPMIEKNVGIAYDALKSQLYSDDDIYLMSATTFRAEVDAGSYLSNLENYLNDLANDSSVENLDLVIYLIGEGDTKTFKVNDNNPPEILIASNLDTWLDDLQNSLPKSRVTIIHDADKSGSFIPVLTPPLEKERIIITSSGESGVAYCNPEGNICFSSFFWSQVANGETLYNALSYAKKTISYLSRKKEISFSCYKPQSPLLDANGNGVVNEEDDYQIARGFTIGIGMKFADDPPQIGSVSVDKTANGAIISAEDITSTKPIQRVWAVIRPIGYCPGYSFEETCDMPEVDLLDPDQDGRYEGIYSDLPDAYKIIVYAKDEDNNVSSPKETKIYQTEGGDIYEPDDTREEANVIVVNHTTPQPHNFHYPGDEDWVTFYGLTEFVHPTTGEVQVYTYRIKASNLGDNCHPAIELYYEDDSIPIAVEDTKVDSSVSLELELPEDGIYYVRLFDKDTGVWLTIKDYDLQVDNLDPGVLPERVYGRIEDQVSREAIHGAKITTASGGTISTHGEYHFMQIPGEWNMDASYSGVYNPYHTTIEVTAGHPVRKDIRMHPLATTTTSILPSGCTTDEFCFDGRFCNGIEWCVEGYCRAGNKPCLDDGLFCNGEESCDEKNDRCLHSGNPCTSSEICNEVDNMCEEEPLLPCTTDADCNDTLFCNGEEICVDGVCQNGSPPDCDDELFCSGVEICDAAEDACVSSGNPCLEGTTCSEETDECVPLSPLPSIELVPDQALCSHLISLPFIMFVNGYDTHFNKTTAVSFSGDSIWPPIRLVLSPTNILVLSLIKSTGLETTSSLDVTVTVNTALETGEEEATEILNLNMLPWILDDQNQMSK
jgi:hypothetical protein